MIVRFSGRLTIALVSLLTLPVSVSSHAAESPEGERTDARPQAIVPFSPSSYLHTLGKHIVDRTGRVVRLRGVNIGGWAGFNYYGELQYDLSKDLYESILEKWTHGLSQWHDPGKTRSYYLTQW